MKNRSGLTLAEIIIILLIALLSYFAPDLSKEDAIQRIKMFHTLEYMQQQQKVLKNQGKKLPDKEMAKEWGLELKRIKGMKFKSVEINQPILEIIFNFDSPAYVVRVEIDDENQSEQSKYFWIDLMGVDRETSKYVWWFSF